MRGARCCIRGYTERGMHQPRVRWSQNMFTNVLISSRRVQQEDMPFTAVREEVVADGLRQDGYRPELVRHCLKLYGTRVDEQAAQGQGQGTDEQGGDQAMTEAEGEGEAAGGGVWSLDERKVGSAGWLARMGRNHEWLGQWLANALRLGAWAISLAPGVRP